MNETIIAEPITPGEMAVAVGKVSEVFVEVLGVIPADADWMARVAVEKAVAEAGIPVWMSANAK